MRTPSEWAEYAAYGIGGLALGSLIGVALARAMAT